MINPIKDNRIVNDMTFAVRLHHFLQDIEVNDLMSYEEKEYLLRVAKALYDYQKGTATQVGEVDYLKRVSYEENRIRSKSHDRPNDIVPEKLD